MARRRRRKFKSRKRRVFSKGRASLKQRIGYRM